MYSALCALKSTQRFPSDENSLGATSEEMKENFSLFLAQTEEWREVEEDLADRRSEAQQEYPAGTLQLSMAAADEVAAYQAVWQGEFDRALSHAKKAIDSLTGGRAPQRYASFWNYLAASWSLISARDQNDPSLKRTSVAYYEACRSAGRGTLWMSFLSAPSDIELVSNVAEEPVDELDRVAAAQILSVIAKIARPRSFSDDIRRMRSQLIATESVPYEEALVYLGKLAGAHAKGNNGADSAPDATWVFGRVSWVAWEAKSEASPDGELGSKDVRQAGSHLRYIESERDESAPSDSVVLLMTPQQRIHPTARAIAEAHVYLVRPALVVEFFDALVKAWHTLQARGLETLDSDAVIDALARANALPSQWIRRLSAERLKLQKEDAT